MKIIGKNKMLINDLKNLNIIIWYWGKKDINVIIGKIRISKLIMIWIIFSIILIYVIGIVKIVKLIKFILMLKVFFIVFVLFCEKYGLFFLLFFI